MRRAIVISMLVGGVVALAGCEGGTDFASRGAQPAASVSAISVAANAPTASGGGSPVEAQKHKATAIFATNASPSAGQQDSDETSKQDASLAILAQSQPDRYLIRNATVTVETVDVREAVKKLTTAVAAAHGYLADMHESTDGLGVMTATMSVRVPYTTFDRSMLEIGGLGKVLDRQATAEDVTEEFVDTQARVRNLKSTELRLLEHLGRTGKLADTLLVEKELNRVREEIEQHEGRVRFLAHRIAFSTITLTLRDKPREMAYVPPEAYSPAKEGSEAVRSLVDFGRGILTRLIWVTVWLPVWGPLALGAWIGWRRARQWILRQLKPPVVASASATAQPTA